MVNANVIAILSLLEVVFVITGLSVYLYLRSRKQKQHIQDLEQQLANKPAAEVVSPQVPATTAEPVEQKSLEDYLREEIAESNHMLGESSELERLDSEPVDESDEEAELRNIMAMRHQFLQLELDAQALSKDPEARRQHMLDGMRALVSALTPEPVIKEVPAEITEDNVLSREKQLQDQIEALRAAVNNQHDVMSELRRILKDHLGDSEEAQEIIAEIEKAEAEAEKLEATLSGLTSPGAAGSIEVTPGEHAAFATVDDADTDMLKNLVGNQQNTINKLKHMLAEAIPDAEAAEDLKQAVDKVQRANQELGTCVMVLEDENSRLRTEVETLQTKMQDLEERPSASAASTDSADEATAEAEAAPEPEQAEADSAVEDIDALLEEVTETEAKPAPETVPEPDQAESDSAVDDIDALLEEVAGEEAEVKPEAEPESEQAEADSAIEDIDALLEEVAETEAEPEPVEEPDKPAAPEATVDDIDALLDEVAGAETEAKPEAEPESEQPVEVDSAVDDIDALLDEVADSETDRPAAEEKPAAEAPQQDDDEDLDALLQDVAAASLAEAEAGDDKPGTNNDDAMDEVDALLAEIAADNKKSGS